MSMPISDAHNPQMAVETAAAVLRCDGASFHGAGTSQLAKEIYTPLRLSGHAQALTFSPGQSIHPFRAVADTSAGLLNPSACTEAAWDICRNGLVERLVVQSIKKFYQLVRRAAGTAQLADEGVHLASSDIRVPRRATVETDHLCDCLKCSAVHVGRGEGEIS
jgi:hypothetical protein